MNDKNHLAISNLKSLMKLMSLISKIFREFGPFLGMNEDIKKGFSVQSQNKSDEQEERKIENKRETIPEIAR
jgi:hypothetical protein